MSAVGGDGLRHYDKRVTMGWHMSVCHGTVPHGGGGTGAHNSGGVSIATVG